MSHVRIQNRVVRSRSERVKHGQLSQPVRRGRVTAGPISHQVRRLEVASQRSARTRSRAHSVVAAVCFASLLFPWAFSLLSAHSVQTVYEHQAAVALKDAELLRAKSQRNEDSIRALAGEEAMQSWARQRGLALPAVAVYGKETLGVQ